MIFCTRSVTRWRAILPFALMLALTACGGGGGGIGASSGTGGGGTGGSGGTTPPSTATEWTWMGGSDSYDVNGVYGSIGVPSTGNAPGSRAGAASWTDLNGNLWMFGGDGYPAQIAGTQYGEDDPLNDLWEYNPTSGTWTWQSGSNTFDAPGTYGAFRVASPSNVPGARVGAAAWTDSSGNLWLFGGTDYNGDFNDLWEFNPTNKEWTWVSGSNNINAAGIYGTLGVASTSNTPGARDGAVTWTDKSGNFWLFGGSGYSDLWKFNPTTEMWTWVSGSNTTGVAGSYGTMGAASPSNAPGNRAYSSGWIDSKGNLWMYGGSCTVGTTGGDLADLWEYNPATNEWTWVAGNNLCGTQSPVYGTEGTPSAQNTPGATAGGGAWIDSSDNLWLFGDITGTGPGVISGTNILWEFNPKISQWVWVSGTNTVDATGNFGTMGAPSTTNLPPGRADAASWTDKSGNFWLFGGWSFATNEGPDAQRNDLWRYQP